jgi:hypothetical protein
MPFCATSKVTKGNPISADFSSAVFRRQIARTAVTCSLGHGLGWVGLHDRILWEVGFAQEWKVELLTYRYIG